jgi:hypothetical protein
MKRVKKQLTQNLLLLIPVMMMRLEMLGLECLVLAMEPLEVAELGTLPWTQLKMRSRYDNDGMCTYIDIWLCGLVILYIMENSFI